ncbi:FISUMP domain-containing protein, partial [Candidatus Venteria ishoeyi]|uniref:FISUMP domain-containing protein n=1 Tax=Candidatus Venteria ishoeyi TaxID=1899563 RepID=UPI00255C5A8D
VQAPSPGWSFINTGSNHTVLIPLGVVTIDGNPIEIGDYIGVFYNASGTLECCGYTEWLGGVGSITAWGSEVGMDNGLQVGEAFTWIVWKAVDGSLVDMIATYNPVFPSGASGTYATNGLSGILILTGNSPVILSSQTIILPYYWSIFSTYINPTLPDIDNVMTPVVSNVSIVKDWMAQIYWPVYGVNQIGNMSIGQGYQIKMIVEDTLTIEGSLIQPELNPIIIPQGWSILGYIRTAPAAIEQMMSPVVSNIIIFKDYLAQIYWPQYGVNQIVDLTPGQGYQIKMLEQDTLIYPANDTTVVTPFACGDPITDFDGNNYSTVLIGSQCWMKENLKSTHYADGTAMVDGTSAGNISGDYTTKYYFDYNNDPANAAIYGKLYTWAAVMNGTASSNT